jgi:hypothetical protein
MIFYAPSISSFFLVLMPGDGRLTTMTATPPEEDVATTNGILPPLPVLDPARLETGDGRRRKTTLRRRMGFSRRSPSSTSHALGRTMQLSTMTPPEDDIATTNGILPPLPVLDLARLERGDATVDDDDAARRRRCGDEQDGRCSRRRRR